MTKIDYINKALAEIKLASWNPTTWANAIQHGYNGAPYRYELTHNYKAQMALWNAAWAVPGGPPPPSAFASSALQDAYIQMAAAYWDPYKWCEAVRSGYKGAPYNYTKTRNWYAQTALWAARLAPVPAPAPVPIPPGPDGWVADRHLQNVVVAAGNPMDALLWPGCKIWFTADPNPFYSRWVTAANAKTCRDAGHEVGVWYVPDQVSHERALSVADTLGTDRIACDVETYGRWLASVEHGVHTGIANLSDLFYRQDAHDAIASGAYKVINEFYWNQSKRRQPDNHNLPVHSLVIAVYDGKSDSQELDAWDPTVADYAASGYIWPSVSVYSADMHANDWAALPRIT